MAVRRPRLVFMALNCGNEAPAKCKLCGVAKASVGIFLVFAKNCARITKIYEMSGDEYVNNMLQVLSCWVDGGIIHFRTPDERHAGVGI